MAEQAGAKNSDDGVGLVGVRLTPVEGLRIDVSNVADALERLDGPEAR